MVRRKRLEAAVRRCSAIEHFPKFTGKHLCCSQVFFFLFEQITHLHIQLTKKLRE